MSEQEEIFVNEDGILNINMDEIPDEMPPIPTGTYTLRIDEKPVMKENKKHTGYNLVVQLRINDEDSAFKDRMITDWIPLNTSAGRVRLQQLRKSLGVPTLPDGKLNLADFVGKVCTASCAESSYKDDNGESKTTTRIKEYMFDKVK